MAKKTPKITNAVFFAPLVEAVIKDDWLSAFDRALLSIMLQLAQKKGYCYASNQYLAYVLNCSVGSISKSISKMVKLGYIIFNEPDPDAGGRIYHRTFRTDLFYKAQIFDPADPQHKPWYKDNFDEFS